VPAARAPISPEDLKNFVAAYKEDVGLGRSLLDPDILVIVAAAGGDLLETLEAEEAAENIATADNL